MVAQKKSKASKFLTVPTRPIPVDRDRSVAGLLEKMEGAGFGAKQLAEAHRIWLDMLDDNSTIYLCGSGNLIPSGMRRLLAYVIKNRFVDVIVMSGTVLFHDIHEILGRNHYQAHPSMSDEELESIIDERRQEAATLVPVEGRKSQEGDTVIVDLEGTFEGDAEAEPIKADDLEIKLGDDKIEKSFTENLVSVEQDEEKEFTVSYPEDFTSPMLAGKTVNYKAKIKSIGAVELPELDDEWAASLDEGFESLTDLRSKLREDLETAAKGEADNRLRGELIQKLIEKHDFEVPNSLIDMQARNLLNNFAQDMSQRGMDLNNVGQDFVQMAFKQMQTQAERDVRGAMLLEKVAEAEGVEVSDAEVAEEIEKLAQHYRISPEEIRNSINQQQGGEANISNNLRTRKAVEALVTNAKITDGEWVDPNQLPTQTEDKQSEEGEKETKAKKPSKAKEAKEDSKEKKPKAEKKKSEAKEPKKKASKKEEEK